MLINLWVKDKETGDIHQVGTDVHDSVDFLCGEVVYVNMQSMGGTLDKGEYEWVEPPDPDGYVSVTPDQLYLSRELIHRDVLAMIEGRTINEKEKLVELFRNAFAAWGDGVKGCKREEFFADFIANGVTVQEWISVKDRLPEHKQKVLCFCQSGIWDILTWDYVEWAWIKDSKRAYMESFVTHWMPLPEPPKGEKETVFCKDCEHLMFSDCYGECSKGHKGIVKPNDTCKYATRKMPKGE